MDTSAIVIVVVIIVVLIIVVLFYRKSGQEEPREEPEWKKPENWRYFLPYQVVFQVGHPEPIKLEDTEQVKQTKDNIVSAMQSFLGSDRKSKQEESGDDTSPRGENWSNRLDPPTPESIITFPSFSLVPAQVSGYDIENNMDPTEVKSILQEAYAELQKNDSLNLNNGFSIQSISPDWLMSNLHHGGATGGPGGRPTHEHTFTAGSQSLRVLNPPASFLNTITTRPGTNISVAILDTAPSISAIDSAYHKWGNPLVVDHPLVRELFGPTGRLTIYRASPATIHRLEHYSLVLNDYVMPDHGTFIAGIIYSGAPNATLHLYEVLSRYGVGTFTSVAQGIIDAINNPIGRPHIINCSLMFCLPDGSAGADLVQELGLPINALTDPAGPLVRTMRDVFADVAGLNIAVVASAGNFSKPGQREPARFPAAFDSVIGVGALPKDFPQDTDGTYNPASYSNLADSQPANGFMTLGGEEGYRQGVLGMYINDFFPGSIDSNLTGWAWWAGTSFAAAIITGLLAGNVPPGISGSGFLPLRTADPIPPPPYGTRQGESVVLIKQG